MGRSAERAPGLTPEQILARIREQLATAVDPLYRDGQRAFFQHEVDTWGVRAAELKRIASEAWKAVKPLPVNPRNRLCTLLWESGKLEEGVLVVYLYERLRKSCGECEFRLFECWIDRYVHNWAHCDGVSTKLIAAAIANDPALVTRLQSWTRSTNRWKRRASAVSLIWEAKRGRHLDVILSTADALLEDSDDMVQKGVGWMLKEAYPAAPEVLASYWKRNAAKAPALVLRIASEKMPRALTLRLRAERNLMHRALAPGCAALTLRLRAERNRS